MVLSEDRPRVPAVAENGGRRNGGGVLCDPRPRWAAGSKNGGVACGNKFLRNTPRKSQALPILAANLAARKVIYTRFACRNANCSAAAIVSFNLNLASVD